MNIDFEVTRPEGFCREEDKVLIPLINDLEKFIINVQTQYYHDTLKLSEKNIPSLAALLVEFAEDLHNELGLWNSLEFYNKQMFNTPLPLFVKSAAEIKKVFDVNRIKYFVHTLLLVFNPYLLISPGHKDLNLLAENLSIFLSERFQNIPRISGIKEFLSQPNDFGWDIKRKLIWAGTQSYLFRALFSKFIAETNKGKMEVAAIDDFICQECTIWSGLGVIDILAKTLDLSDEKANDIRSWYERYLSYYRVIQSTNDTMTLENILNETNYTIRSYAEVKNLFKVNDVILGSIVPYDNYWYWSGVQHNCHKIDKSSFDELRKDFYRKSPQIVYRFDKQLLANAKKKLQKNNEDFIVYFGSSLVSFEDGLSMAAALQNNYSQKYKSLPQNELNLFMKKHELKNPSPRMNFPDSILNSEDGVGVYFNPDLGTEFILYFNDLVSGFKKEGKDLTEDEFETIISCITADNVSPNFVRTMVNKYGDKSIYSCFNIKPEMGNLDYLLHRYKGNYFRNIYPIITLID